MNTIACRVLILFAPLKKQPRAIWLPPTSKAWTIFSLDLMISDVCRAKSAIPSWKWQSRRTINGNQFYRRFWHGRLWRKMDWRAMEIGSSVQQVSGSILPDLLGVEFPFATQREIRAKVVILNRWDSIRVRGETRRFFISLTWNFFTWTEVSTAWWRIYCDENERAL